MAVQVNLGNPNENLLGYLFDEFWFANYDFVNAFVGFNPIFQKPVSEVITSPKTIAIFGGTAIALMLFIRSVRHGN